ncbi:MAG: hypothetical protein KA479_06435 [Saprospiraceae bacterium]|nr:hypothetical protein [Saprospiraceae bacterium]
MEKKKFVLRIDSTTMAALEKWAADEFRSVNGQLEWIITRYLQEKGRIAADQMKKLQSKKSSKDNEGL